MKKLTVFILAAALAVFVGSWPGQLEQVAYAAPHGGGGGHGGGHGGGGHFGGGHHGGGHFGVWFGPGWGWDPFFYPYYPYYPYSPYSPYYNTPAVVVPQQPEEYVMPEPQPEGTGYWYFCNNPKGYYPYVKSCPGGWMKVVPAPAPPGEED